MFIDASALTAILAREEDFRELTARLEAAAVRSTSPLAVWETVVALARILAIPVGEAAAAVEAYLALADIVVLTVVAATTPIALDAFDRYGKGRGSPAGLNVGDCFAYACARYFQQPLLCKGNDFAHTDIDLA